MFEAELKNNEDAKPVVKNRTRFSAEKRGQSLFFKIICEDDGPKSKKTLYNDALFEEEVCEIFLCFTPQKDRYLELEFNHLGAVFAAWIDYTGQKNKINYLAKNPVLYKVSSGAGQWQVEAEIPFSVFKDEIKTEDWYFNVYRIKRDETGGMILSAFSPTYEPNFHKPDRFADFKLITGGN